ncbi:MAG: hypothetical protein EOP88_22400, partial [Verrucomicrobiaceae bacterium]
MAYLPPVSRVLVSIIAFAVAFADPALGNLVFNGSFESDFSSWAAGGNVVIGGILPSTPTNGAHLAVFNSGNTQGGSLTQSFPTVPG